MHLKLSLFGVKKVYIVGDCFFVMQKKSRVKMKTVPERPRVPPASLRSRKASLELAFTPWLKEGSQSKITSVVRNFASQFRGAAKDIAQQAMNALNRFERIYVSNKVELERHYSKTTADMLISPKNFCWCC